MPHLNALVKRFEGRGLAVVGLNREGNVTNERQCARGLRLEYPTLLSMGQTFSDYWCQGIPYTVLIDRDGIIRKRWDGFGPGHEKEIERAVEQWLGDGKSEAKKR